MNLQDPALSFAIALFAGVVAQSVARHLRIPGILPLLALGVLLGPSFANVVRPATLGEALQPIVGLAVAVVLFEGGLNLNINRVRRGAVIIRRLISVGAVITLVGATLFSLFFMGWDWRIALLFGTLVIVTGPTVVNPLTRRIRLKPNLRTILEAEGVLIDPIGAIIAVVALEMILAATAAGAATNLLGLPGRLGLGLLVGLAGGALIGYLLRFRDLVPIGYENIFALAGVLVLFQASHAILPESGIMTVAIAGLVVGNMKTHVARELVEFKEQLTILLVGLLFILLAAAVPLDDVIGLGWRGVATVLALIFLVRPLGVILCAEGTGLSTNEKAFLSWLAPRGIVAFAVSSLFATELAHHEMEAEGAQLRALVFLVIAVTVFLQGGTAGAVARFLRVRMPGNLGYAIVGANPVARTLGRALQEASSLDDEPIVLIDSNAIEAGLAEADGFTVVYGNASEEGTLRKADVESRRAFIALTPNEGVNLLLANRAAELYAKRNRLVAVDSRSSGVRPEHVREADARVLFGGMIDFDRWRHHLEQGRGRIVCHRFAGSRTPLTELGLGDAKDERGRVIQLLPLVHRRGKRVRPVDDGTELRPDDLVWFAWEAVDDARARAWLAEAGWAVEPPAESGTEASGEEAAAAPPEGGARA